MRCLLSLHVRRIGVVELRVLRHCWVLHYPAHAIWEIRVSLSLLLCLLLYRLSWLLLCLSKLLDLHWRLCRLLLLYRLLRLYWLYWLLCLRRLLLLYRLLCWSRRAKDVFKAGRTIVGLLCWLLGGLLCWLLGGLRCLWLYLYRCGSLRWLLLWRLCLCVLLLLESLYVVSDLLDNV